MKLRSLAALAMLCALPVMAQISDSTPVIEASGSAFTKAEFEQLLANDSRYKSAAGQPAARRALAESFGRAFALEAEAKRRQLDQQPNIQLQIRHATQQILANSLLVRLRRDYLGDEAKLTAHLEANKALYQQPRVRQILVRAKGSEIALAPGKRELSIDEARAKAVSLRAKLLAGADFAALAKVESDDVVSRTKGGELGYIQRGATGANFEAAAFSVPVGKVSEVVQTSNGFHILRVDDRQTVALATIKAALANDLAHRDIDALVANGYKLNDAYFAP